MNPLSDELSVSAITRQPSTRPDGETADQLKTGTTTVGIAAEDGVVLASDTRASVGNMVSSKKTKKIYQVHPAAAITISGTVSSAQNLVKTIQVESNLYEARRDKDMTMQALSSMIHNLLRSGAFFVTVPVLGGVDDEGSHVVSYDALGGHTEEEYTATGSGTQFALGVLEQDFEEGLSLSRAREIGEKAVRSAIERDTASGNALMIAEITVDGVEISEMMDID